MNQRAKVLIIKFVLHFKAYCPVFDSKRLKLRKASFGAKQTQAVWNQNFQNFNRARPNLPVPISLHCIWVRLPAGPRTSAIRHVTRPTYPPPSPSLQHAMDRLLCRISLMLCARPVMPHSAAHALRQHVQRRRQPTQPGNFLHHCPPRKSFFPRRPLLLLQARHR
jgi:hypothetical protein